MSPSGSRPKMEAYDGYLYVIVGHGRSQDADVDFFVGPNYLVTVHDGRFGGDRRAPRAARAHGRKLSARARSRCFTASRTRWSTRSARDRQDAAMRHRRRSRSGLREADAGVCARDPRARSGTSPRCGACSRRSGTSWRASRSREFVDISTEMSFRFRDVHDHLVRLDRRRWRVGHDRLAGIIAAAPPRLVSPQALDLACMGKITRLPRRSRQPDRRRRGRRAPGLGRQGTGRERHRRRRATRMAIHVELGGKKQVRVEDDGEGMDAGGCAAGASSATRRARSAGPTIWPRSRRSGSAARRCRRSRRCRISCCGRGRAAQPSGTEIRVNGGHGRVGRRGRRAGGHASSRSTISSTTCRRGGSS